MARSRFADHKCRRDILSLSVHPIADSALGNTSYLVAVGDSSAVVIDPRRDADEHLALATQLGLRIVAVLETHLHADFVSGVREIAVTAGADIYAAQDALLEFAHAVAVPGAQHEFGTASVEVISTPGHTPEHVAYLLTIDGTAAVFTGGSLIVGGAARTDLTGSDRTDELARAQYRSFRRLSALPGDTAVYPTHGAGSFCSTGPARSVMSTIEDERASNPLLAVQDEQEFVDLLLSGYGTYPRYFAHLREVNRIGAPLLDALGTVPELDAAQAQAAVTRGAWLIDGRSVETWAKSHPVGAVSIEIRDAFASWLGWVVPFGEPILFMLEPEQLDDATRLAHRIGYDNIAGWLRFASWRDARMPVSHVDVIDAAEAARRHAQGVRFIDVRQDAEFKTDHIANAEHVELGDIIAGTSTDATEVVTYCGHGERSATAASLLERQGVRAANLRGGIGAWRREGYPLGS